VYVHNNEKSDIYDSRAILQCSHKFGVCDVTKLERAVYVCMLLMQPCNRKLLVEPIITMQTDINAVVMTRALISVASC
jgi:hypothetical protein